MPLLIEGHYRALHALGLLFLLIAAAGAEDFLELRNGTVLKGKISELDSTTVSIETPDGSLIRRPRSEILNIQYGVPKARRVPFYAGALPRKHHRHITGFGTRTQYGVLGYGYQENIWQGIYGTAALGISGYDGLNVSLGMDMLWRNYRRVRPLVGLKMVAVAGQKDKFDDSSWIQMEPGVFGIAQAGFQILIRPNFGIHLAGGYRQAVYGGDVTFVGMQAYDPIGLIFEMAMLMPYAIFTGSGFMQEFGFFWDF